jgi:hypothetical protein
MVNWLTGWDYRKKQTIVHAAGAGTLYQILIKLNSGSGAGADETYGSFTARKVYCENHAKADFSDVRFASSDGDTLLDYCIVESGAGYAYAFVEVGEDLSAVDRDIYVYYGNAAAGSLSNGPNTFVFWEDAENGDMLRWDQPVDADYTISAVAFKNGTCSVRGLRIGINTLKKTLPASCQTKGRVVFWVRTTNGPANQMYYNYVPTNSLGNANCYTVFRDNGHFQYYNGAAYLNLPTDTLWVLNTWYKFECIWNYDIAGTKYDVWIDKSKKSGAGITDALKGASQSKIGFFTSSQGGQGHYWDDVFVTKYVTPEPSFGATGSEETGVVGPTVTTQAATTIEEY